MNAWGKPGPPKRNLITEPERISRLKAARLGVARDDAPLVYYMATPEGECDFPTLLRSRGERVVRLIERPQQLRLQGFEIWAGDASEILQGKMRRNMLSGSRLIELWNPGTNPSTTLPRHGDFRSCGLFPDCRWAAAVPSINIPAVYCILQELCVLTTESDERER
jgi:hypothetical protein